MSSELERIIGARMYRMWFSQTRWQVDGDRVALETGSRFVADWIDAHFGRDVRTIARQTLGDNVKVDIEVAPDLGDRPHGEAPPAEDKKSRKAAPATARTQNRQRNARSGQEGMRSFRSLDTYVVGNANQLAFATATRLVAEDNTSKISPLFIHGDCGLGKTHLLQGICLAASQRTDRRLRVKYVTGEQFTNEYITAVRHHDIESFRRRYRQLDLLAIDDVHFLANKIRTQSEFLHTLDAIGLTGANLVLASDEHPRQIKRFSQALISRFVSGMVVRIERPDRETRRELVRRIGQHRNVSINDVAIDQIVERCIGSVREIEGVITKLEAMHSLLQIPNSGDEIGVVLTEQLFRDASLEPATPVRVSVIIECVCDWLSVAKADLLGSSRHRRVVLGRALVAYLSRELTSHSFPEIARALGRSYHSTVHTADQRLRRQIASADTVALHAGQPPLAIKELVDQLRHEITRTAGRARNAERTDHFS
ncbi:MAG: ATP-binding protein [Phycisphaerales bacterium]|nr:ATP-binding protein [Phycisphaerales bacterium]